MQNVVANDAMASEKRPCIYCLRAFFFLPRCPRGWARAKKEKKKRRIEKKEVNDVHLAADLINSRQDDLSKYLRGNFQLFRILSFTVRHIMVLGTQHIRPLHDNNTE